MEKIAAFDIGSNAVRMAVAALDNEGTLKIIKRVRIPLRLGTEAFSKNEFSSYTIQHAASIFASYRKVIDHEQVNLFRAVATSAYRTAKNSSVLGQEILKSSGIKIEMISGELEAEMIRQALRVKIDLNQKNFLLFDIGGGSIELSVLKEGVVLGAESFPLGTVRLLEMVRAKSDNPKVQSLEFQNLILEHQASLKEFLSTHTSLMESTSMIGTGGNFKRLLKLRKKILEKKEIDFILPGEVRPILEELEKLSFLGRMKKFGLRPDRADVIIPALHLVLSVLSIQNIKKIYAPDTGLIHGILFSMVEGRFQRVIERL